MSSMECDPLLPDSNSLASVLPSLIYPLLVSVGLAGSGLSVWSLTSGRLRTQSTLYAYLLALTALDVVLLLLAVPYVLRDAGVLRPAAARSLPLARTLVFTYPLDCAAQHAQAWLTCLLGLVRLSTARGPEAVFRWRRPGSSALAVLAVALCCCVVDGPRFLELRALRRRGRCFANVTFYDWSETKFAEKPSYRITYSWLSETFASALPATLTFVAAVVLVIAYCRDSSFCRYDRYHGANASVSATERREKSLTLTVVLVLCTFVVTVVPNVVARAYFGTSAHPFGGSKGYQPAAMIAYTGVLLNASCRFFLLLASNSEFRRQLCLSCCCCAVHDEYFEPLSLKRVFVQPSSEPLVKPLAPRQPLKTTQASPVYLEGPPLTPVRLPTPIWI